MATHFLWLNSCFKVCDTSNKSHSFVVRIHVTKRLRTTGAVASFHRLLFPRVYGFIHLAKRRTFYKDINIVLN